MITEINPRSLNTTALGSNLDHGANVCVAMCNKEDLGDV